MSNVTTIDPMLHVFTGRPPASIDTDSQMMLIASYCELCSYRDRTGNNELDGIVNRLGDLVKRFEPKSWP